MLFRSIKKIWNPAIYQGTTGMKGYFEGWYYKLVDAGEKEIITVIPGVSFQADGRTAGAFIQLADTSKRAGTYFTYTIGEFKASSKEFEIRIGQSSFSSREINIHASNGEGSVQGEITFGDLKPWPVTALSPGAMGWYAFVPFMECYHGVLSFNHTLEGMLEVNGRTIDFTGGRGYIEKDWGRSFPKYHVWMQTNHFDQPGTSLMVSVANIPWLGSYFDGFIAGFLHNNRLYTFATYTGARLTRFQTGNENVTIHISSKQFRLEVRVVEQQGIILRAPVKGDMRGRLVEAQTAQAYVRLISLGKHREEIIFEGTGRNTALEIAGKREELGRIKVYGR